MIKKFFITAGQFILPLMLSACTNDQTQLSPILQPGQESTFVEILDLSTNKVRYSPGEEVIFTVTSIPQNTVIQYNFLGETLAEEPLSSSNWSWTPPDDDFKGYMVSLIQTIDATKKVIGTVGVDVSSDWTRFPRYGFLSKFGDVSETSADNILRNLNGYHINGLQYYDWHYKHHIPLPVDADGNAATSWTDLFNRQIYLSTVEHYLSSAKERNMASMFYDLLFGVLNAEEDDGISDQWLMYDDRNHNSINRLDFGDLGEIWLTDPANTQWENYIFDKVSLVYDHLPFDGWHVDQLGNRGTVYDYSGNKIDLEQGYQDFLLQLHEKFPNKNLVMNSVDQFGQKNILSSPVDFAYTEVWTRNQYADLAQVIMDNRNYQGQLNTVLTAYMNYDSQEGNFNTPSVLLADAVIFAFGGSHLELGEHMLSHEYFPNDKLTMEAKLKTSLKEYYDFLVGYENLLRDGGTFTTPAVSSTNSPVQVNNWPPVSSQVALVSKTVSDRQVLHLLNFEGIKTLQWRDNDKIQTAPTIRTDFTIQVKTSDSPKKVWFASPDTDGGSSQELEFTQSGNEITVTVPYLEYWSMIVVEN